MKKEVADYLSTTRQIETIVFDEGDRFMNDLSHLPQILERWAEYKETKKKSALKLSDIEEILLDDQGGNTTIEQVEEEEETDKKKEATPEEVLDVGAKTKAILEIADFPATYVIELGQEVNSLKKVALTAIAERLFNIIFLK